MNKNAVSILCIVLIAFAVFCVGYIMINTAEDELRQEEEQQNVVTENVTNRTERTTNIILTSRVGMKLTELIKFSNVFSQTVVNELDRNGLSNDAKLIIGLDKIYRKSEYQQYMGYSESYGNTYILADNMQTVLDASFKDSEVVYHEIADVIHYDEPTNAFILFPMGFEAGSITYIVDAPYKMTQYSDRVEVLAYRLYVTQVIEMEDVNTILDNYIYYDKAQKILALSTKDNEMTDENRQVDYITKKINAGLLDKDQMEVVKYTFEVEDSQYKMSGYEKIQKEEVKKIEEEIDEEITDTIYE